MNWDKFLTHNESPNKAFEELCNQLFENRCLEEYSDKILNFTVVNGEGGDGGVESYVTLSNQNIIGMQAKWFISSMGTSQINQIRKSIETAIKIRPTIVKYIVCVPRNLSSNTGRGKTTENDRWDELIKKINDRFPMLEIELWNDYYLSKELQKPNSNGIYKYWFEHSEISYKRFQDLFEKSKITWLKTRYFPELNVMGTICDIVDKNLGSITNNFNIINKLDSLTKLCEEFLEDSYDLIEMIKDSHEDIVVLIRNYQIKVDKIKKYNKKIITLLTNEQPFHFEFNDDIYNINFGELGDKLKDSKISTFGWHYRDFLKDVEKLYYFEYKDIVDSLKTFFSKKPFLFLGDPGTGKTQGVTSIVEKMFENELHIPLLINANVISDEISWRDILIKYLGISNSWEEDEIWETLISLAYQKRIENLYTYDKIKFFPKIVIIVDALDESNQTEGWTERINEARMIEEKYALIRFIFTSRPFIYPKGLDICNNIFLSSNGDASVKSMFNKYIKHYNINIKNKLYLQQMLDTPLALKLFCDLNKNSSIDIANPEDVTITQLTKKKIESIEHEFCKQNNIKIENQYIFRSIILLANEFINSENIERELLINKIVLELNIDNSLAEKIVIYLCDFGILSKYCKTSSNILQPDIFLYYPGIQGYFDYVSAEHLIQKYDFPENINFSKHPNIHTNILYSLAIISMQRYNYLITENLTIKSILSDYKISKIQYFAMRNTNVNNALQFEVKIKEIMSYNSNSLITIINELILPLSRYKNHPLGVKMLHKYLSSFETPAKRDLVWSMQDYISGSNNDIWYRQHEIDINSEVYDLSKEDVFDGLPIVYAWLLSSLNNTLRKKYRSILCKWACIVPKEYIKLFYLFANVNDPQIKEEMYAILMCVIYESGSLEITKEISEWIIKNVLDENMIDINRDISIRYYCNAILMKASSFKMITPDELSMYLPPYKMDSLEVQLSIEAFDGTRMNGYKQIHYDLSRYVLVDHFDYLFNDYNPKGKTQVNELLKKLKHMNKNYKDITFEKLIISAAYRFITDMGWNEDEFYHYENIDKKTKGFDYAIMNRYYPATHGSKSNVMTVCEKYVWIARNVIAGYLSDRLLINDDDNFIPITNYIKLDNFYIPSFEANIINPNEIPKFNLIFFPDYEKIKLSSMPKTKAEAISNIIHSLNIDFKKMIHFDNNKNIFRITSESLLCLNMYYNFIDKKGLDTVVIINSLLIDRNVNIGELVDKFKSVKADKQNYLVPNDWMGSFDTACYISPKEACWLDNIKRYDSFYVDDYKEFGMESAVDKCSYNDDSIGDLHYSIPCRYLRKLSGTNNTDGYLYLDSHKNITFEYLISGQMHSHYQEILVTDKDIYKKVKKDGKQIIWLLREYRRETLKSREKFDGFFAEKLIDYLGYLDENNKIITCCLNKKFKHN